MGATLVRFEPHAATPAVRQSYTSISIYLPVAGRRACGRRVRGLWPGPGAASRVGDIQVGGGFSMASPDYQPGLIKGGSFYADYDFMRHVGVEVDFHQLNASANSLYERSYEVGGRYLLKPHGALKPYIKGLYGRGVLNFPQNEANIAYNMFVAGGGVDYDVKRWLLCAGILNTSTGSPGRESRMA